MVTDTAIAPAEVNRPARRVFNSQTAGRAPASVDRLPPHSAEAEQGVLGCILLSPHEALGVCIEKLKAGSEMFYDLRHRTVYEVLVEMYDHKEAIDPITLHQRLKDRQQLDAVGGVAYLSGLPDVVPNAANLGYYLEIVREKYILRRMIQHLHGRRRPGVRVRRAKWTPSWTRSSATFCTSARRASNPRPTR